MKKILIHTNYKDVSTNTGKILAEKLIRNGYEPVEKFSKDCGLIVCIGGDGAFLNAVHKYNFPHIPFIGINTGHLGFFQELDIEDIDSFISDFKEGRYQEQHLSTVKAFIGDREYMALNEILIKSNNTRTIHLDIGIGGSYIEKFSGDGIVIASPAGSTGYNYSLGGSIVDPRVNLLQLTPMAPMNTTAYRSFTSSIILPPDMEIEVVPEKPDRLEIACDGFSVPMYGKDIRIVAGKRYVNLLRFQGYDFWNKVKTKFL